MDEFEDGLEGSDVVLDTIFGECSALHHQSRAAIGPTAKTRVYAHLTGFSFKGEPREPFKEPLEALKNEVGVAMNPNALENPKIN